MSDNRDYILVNAYGFSVPKGGGREAFIDQLAIILQTSRDRFLPGHYVVTIKRKKKDH